MNRADAERLAAQVWTWAASALLVVVAVVAWRLDYGVERELWLIRSVGWGAAGFLALSLCATPLGRLGRRLAPSRVETAVVAAFRRGFGVASAWLALAHGVLAFATYLRASWPALVDRAYLRSGLVALVVLVALLVTSYPRLVGRSGVRLWKPLHRLSYVAALLVVHHLLLSPFAPRAWVLALAAAVAVVALLRWLPARRAVTASPASRS